MDLFKHLHLKIAMLCIGAVLWCSHAMVAYADVTIDSLKYSLNTNSLTATVTGYKRGLTEAEIPSAITSEGVEYSVTTIGDKAFRNCSSLQDITIPNSVTAIGKYTFYCCTSLTSITIPNSVTTIGDQAFYFCTSLTSITISNSVTSIGNQAFYKCTSLTSVTIPNSVTTIGNQAVGSPNSVTEIGSEAFRYCTSLTDVTIPNSVTEIGDKAFCDCSSLTSVTIPNSVTEIGDEAFYKCSSLTSITIPNSVTTIGRYAFESCSSLTSVTITNSETTIGDYAFYYCYSLKTVTCLTSVPPTLGSGVFGYCPVKTIFVPSEAISAYKAADGWSEYNIEDVAYKDFAYFEVDGICYLVTSFADRTVDVTSGNSEYSGDIVIPETIVYNDTEYSVTAIGVVAFRDASSLTSVTIPNSVTEIGIQAFGFCESLTSVTIPNSVTTISGQAFLYCSSLTSVTIPNSVTEIGLQAFGFCTSLTSVTIPNSLTTIGGGAFYYCTSLTSITIPNSVTTIGHDAFGWCTSLTSVTIPNSVTTIGYEAFYECTSLTSITIPNSVTEIGDQAFGFCTSLTSVTIPKSVTTIGSYAFESCTSLMSVTIPNSVTTIGDKAFCRCTSLTSVTCTSEVLTLGSDVFDDVTATAYVPAASAALYNSLNWVGDITIEYLTDYKRSTQTGAFGTICLPYDYTPEGATLYGIESIEDDKVILTAVEGNQGLANTAYIYQATEAEQNFPYVAGEALNTELADVTTGVLTSPASYSAVPDGSYMLQTQDGVQAFYKVDGETYIMPHRAYLTPDVVDSNRDAFRLQFASNEGNQSGLETVRVLTQGAPAIYDLNGRRISTLQKGLNIVGGVKVMVR